MTTNSTAQHWADILELRPEVRASDGSVGELQMSLHKAVYQTVDVPYRKVEYYGDITEPTPNLVGFFARVARRLGTNADAPALFHLDQGMGGGKSHALVGLHHMAASPEGFFATDLGQQVHADAARGTGEVDLTGAVTVTLTADYFSPGATNEVFGPATNLFERFIWALVAGDMDRYQRYVAAGPNKGTLQHALTETGRPVLILLDELMDYVMALADAAHIATMPSEKAFLNALMDACDDVPRVAFVVVMIRSELDERGYSPAAVDFRDYVGARLVRNGQTVAVTEAQDFSAIIRRRLFELPDGGDLPLRDLTRRYTAAADDAWKNQVLDKLGANRSLPGFEERVTASYPFHPELMRLVREEWSQVAGFQRVRSTVAIFARTALHWVTEHKAGRWAPPLIGVGDIPLTVALEQLLSSGLLLGNDRAIQGYRAVANTDITSTDGQSGRAVNIDEVLRRDGVTVGQPAPAVRMATALLCYSIVSRGQARRGATKAEMLLAIFGPAGAQSPYPAAEEVFNKLTGEEGLGALEVTTPTNAPARYHLSIKQTLRMYFTAAAAVVPVEARGELVWEQAQKLASKGVFDNLVTVDKPAGEESLEKTVEGVDSNETRLVLLDPRRWTLLNGKDSASREDITALLGLGDKALRVDNAASCVVACVNTQRRDIAFKRAAEVLAWREVIKQLTADTEDELKEATAKHDEALKKLRRDIERAYQHYAYLVRAGELHVEYKRFDEDSRTALNGGHLWTALVDAGRATQPAGLGAGYLAALLDEFDRALTPREIVQAFYKNPAFPLVTSTDEIRRVLYELIIGDWELVDADGNRLAVASPAQLSINSINQTLRRRQPEVVIPPVIVPPDLVPPVVVPPPVIGPLVTDPDGGNPPGPTVYKRYRLQLSNKSLTSTESRDRAWQLLQELRKVIDPAGQADHQLLSLDITLVTAEGDQGAIESKAEALGAQVTVENDDF